MSGRARAGAAIVVLAALAAGVALAAGDRLPRRYAWSALDRAGALPAGRLARVTGQPFREALTVEGRAGEGRVVRLLVIEGPPITEATWSVRGLVRSAGVEGTAYLELWSHFPGGARFFSRTLAAAGPLRHLGGTSGWRWSVVPFFSSREMPAPSRLEVNLILPGRGTVHLGPLELRQHGPGEDPLATGPS